MNDNEVNKIIAEFMGYIVLGCNPYFNIWCPKTEMKISTGYTQSLDALIPVWDKLKSTTIKIESRGLNEFQENTYRVRVFTRLDRQARTGKCRKQAAAYATAKAILELKK